MFKICLQCVIFENLFTLTLHHFDQTKVMFTEILQNLIKHRILEFSTQKAERLTCT